jgi:hypothetical protein
MVPARWRGTDRAGNVKFGRGLILGAAIGAVACAPVAQQPDGGAHAHHGMHAPAAQAGDSRAIVGFPEVLRIHTLANMRDHLAALQEIQDALANEQYDRASDIAERRLGMSSLPLHGAHELSKFMPEGMRNIGTEMHRAASRFAVTAKDAGATGDVRPALAALSRVSQQCVACHSAYRVQCS